MDNNINNIVKKILGNDYQVSKIVDFEGFLYVFYYDSKHSNPYNDERLSVVGGAGPLKINKETNEYLLTNLIEFHFEHGDNELFFPEIEKNNISFEKTLEYILMRKRINWDDFDEVLKNSNLELNEFDIYSEGGLDEVYIEVKSELASIALVNFLKKMNAKYIIDSIDRHKFFINLNLNP